MEGKSTVERANNANTTETCKLKRALEREGTDLEHISLQKKAKVASSEGSEEQKAPFQTAPHHREGQSQPSMHNGTDKGSRLEVVTQNLAEESKLIFLKWAQAFSESESFETLYCPSQLDHMLNEAYQVENYLKMQKEVIKERMTKLVQTLKMKF